MAERPTDAAAIAAALAAPFDASEVKFKPQRVNGKRAMAVPYVDARAVMDRLDLVVGIDGWQTHCDVSPAGVICRLSLKIEGVWIQKTDVGGRREMPDEGDQEKAAFSGALKRAAVLFGVGRYLYRIRPQWFDFDPEKKRWITQPHLERTAPQAARPAPKPLPEPPPATAPAAPAPPANLPPAADMSAPITEAQVEELRFLCKSRSKSVSALCARFGRTALADLTVFQFRTAVEGLNALPPGPAVQASAPKAT